MIRALDHLLAPLARLLVARGVLFADLTEWLKLHYVRASEANAEGRTTDSRLSVMTGLQRRDIARLRTDQFDSDPPPRPNHLSRLVALWQAMPEYRDQTIPRKGPAPSFDALAASVRRDVHPRTMLDTLVSAGTVSFDTAADTVTLQTHSYQPLAGSEEQLAYLADNVGDHLSAATENVRTDPAPHYERAVHYSHLSRQALAELDAEYRAGQQALLEALNRKAVALQDVSDPKARYRFRAGGYFYSTSMESDQ